MKAATGAYDRNKLLGFMEAQGKNDKDWEDHKPYVPGEKKGKVWQPPEPVKPVDDDDHEFIASTEWDDVLTNASETDMVELAGSFVTPTIFILHSFVAILGFTGLINQVQFHAVSTSDKASLNNAGGWNGRIEYKSPSFDSLRLFFLAAAKCEALRIVPPEPDNTTNVEDCIKKAKDNDKELTRININNIREVKADVLIELLNALKGNTTVEILEMANVGMTDAVGRV